MVHRIACWPDDPSHPYQRLFYAALERHGIRQVAGLTINDAELRQLRPSIDAVHLHWPEYAWRVGVSGPLQRLKRVAGFHRFIKTCRALGLRVLWTAHNLEAHESLWLDRIGLRSLGSQCDLILAHSDRVHRQLERIFSCPVVTMPQGNYDGWYPRPRPRAEVANELGLSPELPTLVLVGALRPYKGVEHAIDAVRQFGGSIQLVIAGTPKPGFDVDSLLKEARWSSWLACVPRPLSDQEFADIVTAGTGLLLPYTKITTSGVLLAGWTLSRGAVTSPAPYFQDLFAEHPTAGRAADDLSRESLSTAIEAYLAIPEDVRWRAARSAADAYPWSACVLPVIDALRRL